MARIYSTNRIGEDPPPPKGGPAPRSTRRRVHREPCRQGQRARLGHARHGAGTGLLKRITATRLRPTATQPSPEQRHGGTLCLPSRTMAAETPPQKRGPAMLNCAPRIAMNWRRSPRPGRRGPASSITRQAGLVRGGRLRRTGFAAAGKRPSSQRGRRSLRAWAMSGAPALSGGIRPTKAGGTMSRSGTRQYGKCGGEQAQGLTNRSGHMFNSTVAHRLYGTVANSGDSHFGFA